MLNRIAKNPDLLLASIVLFTLGAYAILAKEFVELEVIVYAHLISFAIVFSASYRLTRSQLDKFTLNQIKPFIAPRVIYWSAILLSGHTLYKVYATYTSFGLESFMSFRSVVSSEDNDYGQRVSLGVGLSFPAVMAAYFIAHGSGHPKKAGAFLLLGLLLAFVSTSKVFILLWILFYLYQRDVSAPKIVAIGFLFFALFSVSHVLLEKFSSDPDAGLLQALGNTFLVYLLGGLAAYQKLVNGDARIPELVMFVSLRPYVTPFFYTLIPDSAVLPWTSIGRWYTNVYTGFGYWYALLGGYYVVVIPSILGVYYGVIFCRSKSISRLFGFYRVFLIQCLVFVIIGDHFIPALGMHLVFILFSIVVYLTRVRPACSVP